MKFFFQANRSVSRDTITALALLLLWPIGELPAQDFTYTNNNGAITITGYTGPGGNVTIPSSINGLPVTSIGDFAFVQNYSLTSVTVPDSVIAIPDGAFDACTNLASITLGNGVTSIGLLAFNNCLNLTSVTLPNSLTTIKDGECAMGAGCFGAFSYCASLTNLVLGNSVRNIGDNAFLGCLSLTRVIIPNSAERIGSDVFCGCSGLTNITVGRGVTNMSYAVFDGCTNLTAVFFQGNAPSIAVNSTFYGATNATVYYLPRTTGWTSTFGGRPAVLWNPLAQTNDASFGVRQNRFGFNITGTPDIPIVVEATTNLAAPSWMPLQNSTLTNGLIYFSDGQWSNYPGRLYRIRSP
jgi:hypothetical protein